MRWDMSLLEKRRLGTRRHWILCDSAARLQGGKESLVVSGKFSVRRISESRARVLEDSGPCLLEVYLHGTARLEDGISRRKNRSERGSSPLLDSRERSTPVETTGGCLGAPGT